MNSSVPIALCANGLILPGLHATLASLTATLSRRQDVALSIFIQDLSPREIDSLRATIENAAESGRSLSAPSTWRISRACSRWSEIGCLT